MAYQTLALTFADGIAEIRFTRPDLLNRFDMPAHIEFAGALEEVANRVPEIRVLVLSAEGRAFSAGGDFDEMLEAHASRAVRADMVKYAKAVFNGVVKIHNTTDPATQSPAIGPRPTTAGLPPP